jgi:hypothetical protein
VTSDPATEVAAAEPTPPQRVLPTAVVALLVTVLCALAAALALQSLHRMLEPPAGVTALLAATTASAAARWPRTGWRRPATRRPRAGSTPTRRWATGSPS